MALYHMIYRLEHKKWSLRPSCTFSLSVGYLLLGTMPCKILLSCPLSFSILNLANPSCFKFFCFVVWNLRREVNWGCSKVPLIDCFLCGAYRMVLLCWNVVLFCVCAFLACTYVCVHPEVRGQSWLRSSLVPLFHTLYQSCSLRLELLRLDWLGSYCFLSPVPYE